MTDFADLEETEDASWLRLDAQLDPILEHQTEMISAYARIAKVVSAIVGRSSELRPALKVALIKVLEKDVMKPYLQLPQEISFPPSAPEITNSAGKYISLSGSGGVTDISRLEEGTHLMWPAL